MERETTEEKVLQSNANNLLLELPTGYGKTKLALEILKKRANDDDLVLIVVPRLVLINNWKEEMQKWGFTPKMKPSFVTYYSFPKIIGETAWNWIVFDEAHHLSDRCLDALCDFSADHSILLSATVNRNKKFDLVSTFKGLEVHKISLRNAIESQVLPDPKVYFLEMFLDNTKYDRTFTKGKGRNKITCKYPERWKYIKDKSNTVTVQCTQRQYYNEMSELIEWSKKASFSNPALKNIWLNKAGQRLKWLSEEKTSLIVPIIDYLKKHKKRFLTFCNNTEQTVLYGNPVNYKVSDENLIKFNNHEIDNISSCNLLDEGINLQDCQIGLYANLNASERMMCQKGGRILRHKDPIFIIPYFKYTRDEELVEKMKNDYNKDLIKVINNLNEIEL